LTAELGGKLEPLDKVLVLPASLLGLWWAAAGEKEWRNKLAHNYCCSTRACLLASLFLS